MWKGVIKAVKHLTNMAVYYDNYKFCSFYIFVDLLEYMTICLSLLRHYQKLCSYMTFLKGFTYFWYINKDQPYLFIVFLNFYYP